MDEWRIRPTLIEEWPPEIDKIIAIDENGNSELTDVQKLFKGKPLEKMKACMDMNAYMHERWFTITGIVMKRPDFPIFKESINKIKYKHWDEGIYKYKNGERRVVLHSREIRRKEGPFNPRLINYSVLVNDIASMINNTNFKIYSSSIDKIQHISRYAYPFHVYDLNLNFIIERFCWELIRKKETGLILLESRGEKEDMKILKYLVNLLNNGNNYKPKEHFSRIKGVFFNPKWCFGKNNGKASFILLELADLVSYPIFKYAKTGIKDQAFLALERKLVNFPVYNGYGLKMFP